MIRRKKTKKPTPRNSINCWNYPKMPRPNKLKNHSGRKRSKNILIREEILPNLKD